MSKQRTPGRMIGDIFISLDACKRENEALKTLLRMQGLSDEAIQHNVNDLLKHRKNHETAARLLARTCREILKYFPEMMDAAELLRKIDVQGPLQ